ncbi:MAG: hypothetical protein U0904_05675 [Candidatus Nanopelagicales bacterium]|nr:hypothetical protein [Candidatus Nanopelagicales bacterium]
MGEKGTSMGKKAESAPVIKIPAKVLRELLDPDRPRSRSQKMVDAMKANRENLKAL